MLGDRGLYDYKGVALEELQSITQTTESAKRYWNLNGIKWNTKTYLVYPKEGRKGETTGKKRWDKEKTKSKMGNLNLTI